MLNPTANNYLLPCAGDPIHEDEFTTSLRNQSMAIRIGWEKTPIFDSLIAELESYYSSFTMDQLRDMLATRGMKAPRRKYEAVEMIASEARILILKITV